jgi:hypothetical protein
MVVIKTNIVVVEAQLKNLNKKLLVSLGSQMSQPEHSININHINAIRALISAIALYFNSGIPQIDSATGLLISESRCQLDRECLLLKAVAIYDKYLTKLNETK